MGLFSIMHSKKDYMALIVSNSNDQSTNDVIDCIIIIRK